MKAVVQDVYGSTDALRFEDIEMPVIGDDEVLVRVRAAGVDPGVWHLMTGRPYLVRLMGMGVRRPKVPVRGRDLSGVVEAVGSRVTRFIPGDEVYGVTTLGSFAEYARSRESDLARKPANLTFEQAAAVPVSGMTALQGLRDVGRRAARPARAGHRRGRRRRLLRRPAGPRVRRPRDGHVQHREDRPRPVHRRRRRDRLHPRGGRRASDRSST